MKVYLFNDTSHEKHAGSQATMRVLESILSEHDIIARHRCKDLVFDHDAWKRAEAVIVNGEGTIHHGDQRGNFLLNALWEAHQQKKKAVLLNAVLEDPHTPRHPLYKKVLPALDLLTVREPRSKAFAKKMGGEPQLYPDLCVADVATVETKPPKGVVAGGVGSSQMGFAPQLRHECYRLRYLNEGFGDVVGDLSNATCYITGQHHGVYAALLAGVPFVSFPANTHKIHGLLEMLNLPLTPPWFVLSQWEMLRAVEMIEADPVVYRSRVHEARNVLTGMPRLDAKVLGTVL